MGNRKQNTYSDEFKDYVTKMVVLDGRKTKDISDQLEIPYDTLQRWTSTFRRKQREAEKNRQNQLLSASEYQKLYEEERQQKLDLQEENDILKKAMHVFTQEKK